ncbi:MAG: XRE family transcriptional regulator [Deltaproteobacteria bacterium]|jgi:Zn-dependent peptidase ImmA (M78 family)/transcriptional regulator with XRE-family HTH domain|nr:XRE family transcriptional regulator [Deltaproteobacteria bacterium]
MSHRFPNIEYKASSVVSDFGSPTPNQEDASSQEVSEESPIDREVDNVDILNRLTIAKNVYRLRKSKRLSQKDLAQKAGISLKELINLEKGVNKPLYRTFENIAKALEVNLPVIIRPVKPLKRVRFRATKKMCKSSRTLLAIDKENLLAEVSNWLSDFCFLEELLNDNTEFKLNSVLNNQDLSDPHQLIAAAKDCRKKLNLQPHEPIYNLGGLLESAGVKIGLRPIFIKDFFGLSVGIEDGGPAIIVNARDNISIERRIFTTAHELAHLIFHFAALDVERLEESDEEEKIANFFASHFLMPNEAFLDVWGQTSGDRLIARTFSVKRIFRVSYKTVLNRLVENKLADKETIWWLFNQEYKRSYGDSLKYNQEPAPLDSDQEPFELTTFDFREDRLRLLTRQAVENHEISFGRGAEILGLNIEEMRELSASWNLQVWDNLG